MHNIRIHGIVDTGSYSHFIYSLDEAEESYQISFAENNGYPPPFPTHIEIMSEGGTSLDALAFASRIRRSPLDITITAVGLVASAAVIILAAGKKGKRQMCKDAWVMVHEDSTKIKGDITSMEAVLKHHRRLEDQWCALLEEHTGTSREVWAELNKNETYLSSAQCLDLGIVDEIV